MTAPVAQARPTTRSSPVAPVDGTAGSWLRAEGVVCAVVLISFGLRISLPGGIPFAVLVGLAAAPLWSGRLRRYRSARGLLAFGGLVVVVGLGLTVVSAADRQVVRSGFLGDLGTLLLVFIGTGAVLWGREVLGDRVTGLMFGAGMLAGAALHGYSSTLNFWKGAYSTPVAIFLLALTVGRPVLTFLALALLAGLSVAFDSRSILAVFAICALLTAWQRRPGHPQLAGSPELDRASGRTGGRRVPWPVTALALLVLLVVVYLVGTQALVSGLLGQAAQQRSLQQIDASGSLLLGGRPELAATVALMAARFGGYGFGVHPNGDDLTVAKTGLASINYDPNNGYVENFMFGNGIELHSIVGDLWSLTGPIGIVLAAVIVVLLVRQLADTVAGRTASGLALFATVWTFWNIGFSPLLGSLLPLIVALGYGLPRISATAASPSPSSEPRTVASSGRGDSSS